MIRNGKDPAAILRAVSRKTVVLEHATARARAGGLIGEEDSVTATFGRVDNLEAARHGALIAQIARRARDGEDQGADAPREPQTEVAPAGLTELDDRASRLLLQLCMIRPRFWAGDAGQCPEDWITAQDLGEDFAPLLRAVEEHLGIGAEAAKKSGGVRGGLGAAAGPARQEVPGAADGDPAPAAVGTGPAAGDLEGGRAGGG